MAEFFGTDGIRGEYGKNLTCDLAFKVGNALAQIKKSANVLVGRDTRVSGQALLLSLCAGLLQGGANAVSVGVCPSAGVSFLTESERFDFGVMITASHNPPNFNGIKIFTSAGSKLCESEENLLEEHFKSQKITAKVGTYLENFLLKKRYVSHLKSCIFGNLNGMRLVLDGSNGAASKIAPNIFCSLGAQVSRLSCGGDGEKINVNCGCLHMHNLAKKVTSCGADVGFAFDGDADRVLAVDENGEVFDGDKLLFILAKHFKENGLLNGNCVVGTSHTNSGIMVALNRNKINLVRTDIGDKYVIDSMNKLNLTLGGEQSGHIIMKNFSRTGDGILTALKICEIIQKTGKTLSQLFDAHLIPQCNINVQVRDKMKVLNSEMLQDLILKISNEIAPAGRVLVRASGTEDKVRVMVEHPTDSEKFAKQICEMIERI